MYCYWGLFVTLQLARMFTCLFMMSEKGKEESLNLVDGVSSIRTESEERRLLHIRWRGA